MPGTLAEWYTAVAGPEAAVLMGKPAPRIYEAAAALAPGVPRGRWFAVGDSLQHDVCGAAAAGMGPACFIVGGIHAEDARLRGGPEAGNCGSGWDADRLAALVERHCRGSAGPAFAAARMEW
jgi:ribonucleotide monophosphatase NagD (HAD superfamily)